VIYLYAYLAVGFIVFLAVFISSEVVSATLRDLLGALHRGNLGREEWSDQILEHVFVPVLAAVAVTVAWPYAIYLKCQSIRLDNSAVHMKQGEEKTLSVTSGDLIQRMSVSAIEGAERIIDPYNAVPDLPFGHLNSAWEKFKLNAQTGDEIWTFKATWDQGWLKQECHGYALLRGNEVPHHFMTGWKNNDSA